MIITDSSVIEDLLTAFHYQQEMYNERGRGGGGREGEEERERKKERERRGSIDMAEEEGGGGVGGEMVLGVGAGYQGWQGEWGH